MFRIFPCASRHCRRPRAQLRPRPKRIQAKPGTPHPQRLILRRYCRVSLRPFALFSRAPPVPAAAHQHVCSSVACRRHLCSSSLVTCCSLRLHILLACRQPGRLSPLILVSAAISPAAPSLSSITRLCNTPPIAHWHFRGTTQQSESVAPRRVRPRLTAGPLYLFARSLAFRRSDC